MRVEVETDEALGLSMPRKLHFDWRVIEVVEILDQFRRQPPLLQAKGRRRCSLHPAARNRYEWSLTMFASQEAQAIAAHSGAGMHPYPAGQPN
jgi:hypothetical protein